MATPGVQQVHRILFPVTNRRKSSSLLHHKAFRKMLLSRAPFAIIKGCTEDTVHCEFIKQPEDSSKVQLNNSNKKKNLLFESKKIQANPVFHFSKKLFQLGNIIYLYFSFLFGFQNICFFILKVVGEKMVFHAQVTPKCSQQQGRGKTDASHSHSTLGFTGVSGAQIFGVLPAACQVP